MNRRTYQTDREDLVNSLRTLASTAAPADAGVVADCLLRTFERNPEGNGPFPVMVTEERMREYVHRELGVHADSESEDILDRLDHVWGIEDWPLARDSLPTLVAIARAAREFAEARDTQRDVLAKLGNLLDLVKTLGERAHKS